MFIINWAAHWNGVEYLQADWFKAGVKNNTVEHPIEYKGSIKYKGACTISIKNLVATLDYEQGQNKAFNIKHGCEVGVSQLTFADETFSFIEKYEWKPSGEQNFFECDVKITNTSLEARYLLEEAEGDKRLVSHLLSERSTKMRKFKINDMLKQKGSIYCEICEFNFGKAYGEIGEKFCEVHHEVPLKKGARKTNIDGLKVLCSNCHRMIHRSIGLDNRAGSIMSVKEFSDYLRLPETDAKIFIRF